MSAPTRELLDEIYRQKILQARLMTPEERVVAGLELSQFAVQVMTDGVRHQFPHASEEEVDRIVRERVNLVRRLKDKA